MSSEVPFPKREPQIELRTLFFSLLRNGLDGHINVAEFIDWSKEPPHVVLGDCRWTGDESTKDFYIDREELHIEVITNYGGTLENLEIVDDVKAILTTPLVNNTMCFPSDSRFILLDFEMDDGEMKAVRDYQFEQATIITKTRIKQVR